MHEVMHLLSIPPVDEHSQQEDEAEEGQSWNYHEWYQPLHTAQPGSSPWSGLVGQVGHSTGTV